jgi:hypothetical protein
MSKKILSVIMLLITSVAIAQPNKEEKNIAHILLALSNATVMKCPRCSQSFDGITQLIKHQQRLFPCIDLKKI